MNSSRLRYYILFFFFCLFSFLSIRHFIYGGAGAASIHALCPFGAFESIFYFFQTGAFIPQVMISGFILAGALIATAIIFKRSFCGWICPFGAVQEGLAKIRKKKVSIPDKIDRSARYFKYVVLTVVIITSTVYGSLVFTKFDPFATFFHFGKGIIWNYDANELSDNLLPFVITLIVLLASIFIERFWCKYFCPLGAIEALLSKIGLRKLKRDQKCMSCGICDKKCPVGLSISNVDEVTDAECIDCGICVEKCPVDSLSFSIGKKKIPAKFIGIASIFIILGTVGATKAVGIWRSVPTVRDYVFGVTERIRPEDVKGWMTINDISVAGGLPVEQLISDLKLPSDISVDLPVNQIKEVYGNDFHASVIRDYLARYYDGSFSVANAKESQCPWNIINDPAPGACGLYTDKNTDQICDYSE